MAFALMDALAMTTALIAKRHRHTAFVNSYGDVALLRQRVHQLRHVADQCHALLMVTHTLV